AFLQADRVDDAFALKAFQARFDDFPLRGVHHDGDFGDVRLGSDEIQESGHRRNAVDHPFVHTDVDDLRAVLDLLPRDRHGGLEIAGFDQLSEPGRAGDVGALADVNEVDGSVGNTGVVFPLTPALFPGERKSRALVSRIFRTRGFAAVLRTVLPLPSGEGRGEGERVVRLFTLALRPQRAAMNAVPANRQLIESAEAEARPDLWRNARRQSVDGPGDCTDMRRRSAATAADDVQKTRF